MKNRYDALCKLYGGEMKAHKKRTISPQERLRLKKQLDERTKVRRRKEDARRQHIYK